MSERPATLPKYLPNGRHAVVQRDKIRHYCLSMDSEEGAHKARLWKAVAGFEAGHAAELQATLIAAADRAEVNGWRLNRDGSASWQTRMTIRGRNGQHVTVQARWRTLVVGNAPRLTTAWPEKTV